MTPEEEARGWEELRGRWPEEEAHRAWLAGFTDLEGLARAGQRYRDAARANPADPIAARFLAEVVKRATVHGLASLPRTPRTEGLPRRVKTAILVALGVALAVALWWASRQIFGIVRAR